jgi:hypothetical protein
MPKILEELYECKLCGFAPTNQKGHYERHMRSVKHKQCEKPELAKRLADLRLQQMENKSNRQLEQIENTAEIRQKQIEKDLELRQKQAEIKEQMIEAAVPERVITHSEMINTSDGMLKFQDKLVVMGDTVEDYSDIYNGVKDFQDIFKRDFSALYATDKVVVIDKDHPHKGYWINNAPCHQLFRLEDKICNGLTSILKCIPDYHETLKDAATKIGFKTEKFKLEDTDKKELEEWIKDEITFLYNHKG